MNFILAPPHSYTPYPRPLIVRINEESMGIRWGAAPVQPAPLLTSSGALRVETGSRLSTVSVGGYDKGLWPWRTIVGSENNACTHVFASWMLLACVDPPHRLVYFQNDFRTYNLGSPTTPVNLNEDTARDRVREVEGGFLATVTLHHAVLQRLRPMRACTQVSPPSPSTPSPTRLEDELFIRHVVVELLMPIPHPASQSRPVPVPSESRYHVPQFLHF